MASPVNVIDASTAGGVIYASVQGFVRAASLLVSVNGSLISPHGDSPHNAARTANGATWFRINSIPVNRNGDMATCGHLTANGLSFFRLSSSGLAD